ncbi:MAG: serine O-acetyltransferase [Paracoccaceae bacterium]|jgi:serine O-acetyltransferase
MKSEQSSHVEDDLGVVEELPRSAATISGALANDAPSIGCNCCLQSTQQQLESGWNTLRVGADAVRSKDGFISTYILRSVLNEPCYVTALATTLASQMANRDACFESLKECFSLMYSRCPELAITSMCDLFAYVEKDPACNEMAEAFLFYKGFHAVQVQRLASCYWQRDEVAEAYWLQNRASVLFGVDIHPAARLGGGLFVDHATGIVIGETVEVGDNVSLLHGVTLGGTGTEVGDRHPKIGNSVTIGANATLLGNIRIGDNSVIGASTVVLKDLKPGSIVVGNPARHLN